MKQEIEISDTVFKNILFTKSYKPKLTIDEQIIYMRENKGIRFEIMSESDAKNFLENNNYYFKIKAYCKCYHRDPVTKKYSNCEFAYLRELSTIDAQFRKLILKMSLDIEHFLKVKLVKDISENPKEDGYKIVSEFCDKNPNCSVKLQQKTTNHFTKDLLESINHYALWNFVEVISFGDLIFLIKFYYEKYPDEQIKEILGCLTPIRHLRNAAAHNNCLFNHLSHSYNSISPTYAVMKKISDIRISRTSRQKKLRNPVLHDFCAILYVFDNIISSQDVKRITYEELQMFFVKRLFKHKDYFNQNTDILSAFNFLKKVIDFFASNGVY